MSLEKDRTWEQSSRLVTPLTRYNSVTELISYLKAEHSGVQIVVTQLGEVLNLEILFVPRSGRLQGAGRHVMESLTEYADEQNLVLKLQPDDAFGTPQQQLLQFYRKFGFTASYVQVDNDSGMTISMVREPSTF